MESSEEKDQTSDLAKAKESAREDSGKPISAGLRNKPERWAAIREIIFLGLIVIGMIVYICF